MGDSKFETYEQKRLQDGGGDPVDKVPDEVPDKVWSIDHVNVVRFYIYVEVFYFKSELTRHT